MSQSLDFSLPQGPPRKGPRLLAWLTLGCAAASLAILVLLLLRGGFGAGPARSSEPALAREHLRDVAQDLEKRALYREAAEVWGEYAAIPGLEPADVAEAVFLRGKNLVDAGDYGPAARVLTEYEHLDVSQASRRRAAELILECLSALGKEEARESLLEAYTSFDARPEGIVLARVGGESITIEGVRKQVAAQIESMLRMQDAALTSEEAARRAQELARERLESPETLEQALQQVISLEVLYREALARDLGSSPECAEAVKEFRRSYLAQKLIQRSVDDALRSIGPTDLENHYKANLDEYVEKPAVEFSVQKFPTEAAAQAALASLVDSDFQKGAGPAVQGEPIPGIGRSAEATAHLFALDEGKAGGRAIEIGGAWYVFRCDRKREKRQKSLDEALPQVRADLARAKQAEAAEKLQAELLAKYTVDIVAEDLRKAAAEAAAETGSGGDESGGEESGGEESGGEESGGEESGGEESGGEES
ncbi:MAG: peptidyl-prolyl cis-trans isomerase, partial [Planctomycetes bacterium]|nr:peptidyl-prolyl cis-trans isomerase [Planctomycetota bacterium]